MPIQSTHKDNKYEPRVPAIDQTMSILAYLSKSIPVEKTLTDICRQVGIHKSRGYALLSTLQKYEVVDRDPGTKTYRMGPGLLPLAKSFLDHLDIRQVSQPVLSHLSQTTRSTVLLGLINRDSLFVVSVSEGQKDIGISLRIGHRFDLTYGAHGKAIMAFAPVEERVRILNSGPLYFYGDPNRPDLARLEKELAECREIGYAVDMGELQPGIAAVSAPISGPGGRLIGCLILVGLFSEEEVGGYGPMVTKGAGTISRALGGSHPTTERYVSDLFKSE